MLENPDILDPQIQIEKDTLDALINLFGILASTGLDPDSLVESAGEAIAAIAGEDYDKDQPVGDLIRKRLGINFRTPFLDFKLEYFAGMVPAERLVLQKRIQDAADQLSNYRDANIEAFNTSPAVWMPVSQLPKGAAPRLIYVNGCRRRGAPAVRGSSGGSGWTRLI
jgi:hypothetical protein